MKNIVMNHLLGPGFSALGPVSYLPGAVVTLTMLLPAVEIMLGMTVFKHFGEMSPGQAGLIVLLMVTLTFPWMACLRYKAKLEKELQRPNVTEGDKSAILSVIENLSLILILNFQIQFMAILTIVGLVSRVLGG